MYNLLDLNLKKTYCIF